MKYILVIVEIRYPKFLKSSVESTQSFRKYTIHENISICINPYKNSFIDTGQPNLGF